MDSFLSLLMEWGIIRGNDAFLYGEKLPLPYMEQRRAECVRAKIRLPLPRRARYGRDAPCRAGAYRGARFHGLLLEPAHEEICGKDAQKHRDRAAWRRAAYPADRKRFSI